VLRHIGCNCVLLRQLFSLLLVHSLVWLPKVHLAVLFVLKCLHHCEVCDYISFGVTRSLEWMMLNGLKLQTQDAVTVDAGLNVGKSEPGNVCEICNKSFGIKAALRMHLLRAHRKCKLAVISDVSNNKHAKSSEVPCEQSSSETGVKCAVEKDAHVSGRQLCSNCGKLSVNISAPKGWRTKSQMQI